MLSAGVTKASKKRHVRRAVSRNPSASLLDIAKRPATSGDWLVQRANAGETSQSIAKGSANGQVPSPENADTAKARPAMTIAPAIRR